MRLLLTALTCAKGDVEANLARHLATMAAGVGCDLVVLPEMSLTGYRPSAAIAMDHLAVRELIAKTANGPAVCFGLAEATSGKPYITQVVAAGGDVVVIHRKAHLGDDEMDDFQLGTPADRFQLAGIACSIAVCAEIGRQPPYRL